MEPTQRHWFSWGTDLSKPIQHRWRKQLPGARPTNPTQRKKLNVFRWERLTRVVRIDGGRHDNATGSGAIPGSSNCGGAAGQAFTSPRSSGFHGSVGTRKTARRADGVDACPVTGNPYRSRGNVSLKKLIHNRGWGRRRNAGGRPQSQTGYEDPERHCRVPNSCGAAVATADDDGDVLGRLARGRRAGRRERRSRWVAIGRHCNMKRSRRRDLYVRRRRRRWARYVGHHLTLAVRCTPLEFVVFVLGLGIRASYLLSLSAVYVMEETR